MRRVLLGGTAAVMLSIAGAGAAIAQPVLQAPTARMAAVQDVRKLKVQPASANAVVPFWEAMASYEDAVRNAGGKAPADAPARLRRLAELAKPMGRELAAYSARIEAAGEAKTFDEMTNAHLIKAGATIEAQEVVKMGGATRALAQVGPEIEGDLAALRRAAGVQSFGSVVQELFGATPAQAGLRYKLCMLTMWAAPGPSPDQAYKLCNRYS